MSIKNFSSSTEIIKQDLKQWKMFERSLVMLLKKVVTVLHRNGCTWWVSGGTALGFVRNESIIFGDNDVDIAIDASTLTEECVLDLITTFHNTYMHSLAGGIDSNNPYVLNVNLLLQSFWSGGFAPFRNWKIRSKEWFDFGKGVKIHPELDIFVYIPHEEFMYKTVFPNRVRKHPIDRLIPVSKVHTQYGWFNAPGKSIEYLESSYGATWHTPIAKDMNDSKDDPHQYDSKFFRREIGDVRYDYKNKVSHIFPASTYSINKLINLEGNEI